MGDRGPDPVQLDREWLYEQYVVNERSARDIASDIEYSRNVVNRNLRDYGIRVRDNTELRKRKPPSIYTNPAHGYECIQYNNNQVRHHRLIAVAEHGFDAVSGSVVHHETPIPWLNYRENLEVHSSQSEHIRQSHSDPHNRKLSDKQVREIKRRLENGETQLSIAEDMPVSSASISNIARGKTYTHVSTDR